MTSVFLHGRQPWFLLFAVASSPAVIDRPRCAPFTTGIVAASIRQSPGSRNSSQSADRTTGFCPTGKSLLIFRNGVKPRSQKYFCLLPRPISSLIVAVLSRQEGRCARHQRGAGCGGRGWRT